MRSTLPAFAWRDGLNPRKPQPGQEMSRPKFIIRSFRYLSSASPELETVLSFTSLVVTVRIANWSGPLSLASGGHSETAKKVFENMYSTHHWRECFRARYVANVFSMKTGMTNRTIHSNGKNIIGRPGNFLLYEFVAQSNKMAPSWTTGEFEFDSQVLVCVCMCVGGGFPLLRFIYTGAHLFSFSRVNLSGVCY
jgi:hypothetical protein